MPEGHTVRRLARDLARTFGGGHPVRVTSPQGRFAPAAELLDGQPLLRTDALGKHLFLGFPAQRWVHIHLGLYGRFPIAAGAAPAPQGALRLRIESDDHYADLRGPITCELIGPADKAVVAARLGADPLRRDAHPELAWARLSRSTVAIGLLLMDQTIVSGVGNVFRAEVLFRHRVSPFRPGRDVTLEEWEAMWADLTVLLRAGVRSNRIVTTLPEHRARRTGRASEADAFYVYRRTGEPCRSCGTAVSTALLAGRNLFWCPTCQAV